MATEKDLINAVRESLKAGGELGRIKAEMRTEVIKLLDNSNREDKSKIPKPPHTVMLMNELVREYLNWMEYKYSSTVLVAEADLPRQPLDRALLVQGLGVREAEKGESLPLLCSIVDTLSRPKDD